MTDTLVDKICDKFDSLTKKPEKFISGPEKLIDNIKELIKETYDFTKKEETSLIPNTLPSLIVDDFDVEQIWQQIELQNNSVLTEYLSSVSRLIACKDKLWFFNSHDESNVDDTNSSDSSDDESSINNENLSENESEGDQEKITENDDNSNKDCSPKEVKKTNSSKKLQSVVDDDFFKLNEMEEFLNREERNANKTQNKDDSDDEESVDLFDIKSDDELNDEFNDDDDDDDDNVMNPKYDEFFGESKNTENNKKRKRPDTDNEESNDDENNDVDDDNEEISNIKSSLELREERLHRKIEAIEKSALKEKSWQLKGEVTADKRPQNSLLQEIVDFDMTVRPAPVITEETTYKLEDVIKNRIRDKVWDDVERKTKVVETPIEYKKKLVLDQEKSKQSLAQIYENEYLKQKEALDPDIADKPDEESKEHTEIKAMMKSLFAKLDALSNFHFTPKLAAPELRVVNNLPAINMEEVAPVAVSDAALLAPEEIKNKPKGDEIGKEERTKTDKKRERRHKKIKQREHAKEKKKKEKMIEKMRPGLGNKYSKQKTAKLLDTITKERNIDKMDETLGGAGVKSSTAFFTQLQDEVRGQIKAKTSTQNKKTKPLLVAKKLKL